MKYRYIASCVFTRDYPELSLRIQDYLKERFGMEIIRCCAEKYKVRQFEEVMAPSVCEQWKATPHYIPFEPNIAVFPNFVTEISVPFVQSYINQYVGYKPDNKHSARNPNFVRVEPIERPATNKHKRRRTPRDAYRRVVGKMPEIERSAVICQFGQIFF